MTIVHIVLFEFKPNVPLATINDVCRRMLNLKTECIHPETKKPYVQSSSGGRDNSPEGQQGGFSHGFVVYFENEQDREYYLEKDPAHLAFVKTLDGIVQRGRVVDYEPNVF